MVLSIFDIFSYIQSVISNETIGQSEADLPRQTRVTLRHLQSGWCLLLNGYMYRLDSNIDNVCPKSGNGPHYNAHHFQCPANRTELPVLDLWTKPKAAANFLELKMAEPLREGLTLSPQHSINQICVDLKPSYFQNDACRSNYIKNDFHWVPFQL